MIKYLFIAFIRCIRPLLGPASCKFPLSCTEYAIKQLREKPLISAFQSIIRRLITCGPFSSPDWSQYSSD